MSTVNDGLRREVSFYYRDCPTAQGACVCVREQGAWYPMTTPVCPIISVRSPEVNQLCLGEECALYLPPAKKCSLVYIGYKAMMDIQKLQQQSKPAE